MADLDAQAERQRRRAPEPEPQAQARPARPKDDPEAVWWVVKWIVLPPLIALAIFVNPWILWIGLAATICAATVYIAWFC